VVSSDNAKVVPLYRSRPCPICGKPSVREFHPFSSKRCTEVDLNRWLSGKYAIPAVEAAQEGEGEADDGEK
jgi:endogenous inhibitor of DNA gyrase (YacG/DUF329 family)